MAAIDSINANESRGRTGIAVEKFKPLQILQNFDNEQAKETNNENTRLRSEVEKERAFYKSQRQDKNNIYKETIRAGKKAVTGKSKIGAIKEGVKIGNMLRKEIAEGNFNGFIVALCLAIIKDGWDLIDISGITGALFNIFITVALLMVIMFQGIWLKRWLIKKFLGRFIIIAIAEFIPGFSIFPWYILSVLLIKHSRNEEIEKKKKQLELLNKDVRDVERSIGPEELEAALNEPV